MYKKLGCLALAVVLSLQMSSLFAGGPPPPVFTWDGDTDLNWFTAANWFDEDASAEPGAPPSAGDAAEIITTGAGNPEISAAGATAAFVRVGLAAGPGEVTVNAGGGLTVVGDINVGNDLSGGTNGGTFNMNGNTVDVGDDINIGNGVTIPSSNSLLSPGVLNMSTGTVTVADDLFVQLNSSLTMTGGSLSVGDKMWILENSTFDLNGGDLTVGNDFQISHNAAVTVNGSSIIIADKLNFEPDPTQVLGFNPTLTINSGFVRAEDYDLVANISELNGVTEINGDGLLQIRDLGTFANWNIATALAIIAEGVHLISSTGTLDARSIIVAEFTNQQGNTSFDVAFTEVFVVGVIPEPASVLLLGLGGLGLLLRRKRAR